eukprot:4675455-Ditylum_brightwellii.AAC.1
MSLDIENMYPSVRLQLIRKALTYYLRGLSEEDKTTINNCLNLIKFGMRNMLAQYHSKYYAYKSAMKGQIMGMRMWRWQSEPMRLPSAQM